MTLPRQNLAAGVVALLITSSSVTAAEPVLQAGARLALSGSRLAGGAAPEVVDWDNDGLNDLVVGYFSGALSVYVNRGIGQTGPVFEWAVISRQDEFGSRGKPTWMWRFNKATCVCPGPGRLCPRVVDWDNDGKKDLVIGDGRGAQTRVWTNIGTDGEPVFSTRHIQYLPPDAGVRPYHETVQPWIADWNGDGRRDLIMGRNRGIYVYLNEGTDDAPQFDFDRSRLGAKIRNVFPSERLSPVVMDWDGDGRQDLVVGSQRGDVWFARNVGSKTNPQFTGYTPVRAGGKDLRVESEARIAIGDLDGDGRDDLVVGDGTGQVRFFQAENPNPPSRARPARPKKPDDPPAIATQPADELVGIGQPANLRVVATGTPPVSYQWKKNGHAIPKATGPEYSISKAAEDDTGTYSVIVQNAAGSISSEKVTLRVKSLPGSSDDVPVIGIRYQSPVVEPATPGVLTLTRTGNTATAVTVKLTSRRGHDPVIASLHYIPVPTSITLESGQTTARILVTPIDDTLANGTRSLTFQVVANPAYRLASKLDAATMTFLDDDCPDVGITLVKSAEDNPVRTFKVTARPAPRRDTEVAYSIGGTAVGGVDYQVLPGTVTIPAGETSAAIVVQPYRHAESDQPAEIGRDRTVVLTLPSHRFTFFDFYGYLTNQRSRTATAVITSSDDSPLAPELNVTASRDAAPVAEEKLRAEVSQLGWILFTGRSGGPNSDLDLFVMRPDGSSLRNITGTPEFDEFSARVSPGGRKLLYRRAPKADRLRFSDVTQQDVGTKAIRTWPGHGTLVIANVNGSAARPLGGDGDYAWATWGPAGKRIACLEYTEPKESALETQPGGAGQQKASWQIVIRDAETMNVVQELPAAGIHRQAVWSPDGKRICGPARMKPGETQWAKGIEYPLGVGSLASLDIESGKRTAMGRFPDWSPVWATDSDGDWFQGGSPEVLHSANNYGICPAYYPMLWRSGLDDAPSQLVFGEYMKHVGGGCTSPDDRYAIFVIGGNTWPLQGRMAIIRLADAPIARGSSPLFHEVLADYFPTLTRGPVLDLLHVPEGFDPHWTSAEFEVGSPVSR